MQTFRIYSNKTVVVPPEMLGKLMRAHKKNRQYSCPNYISAEKYFIGKTIVIGLWYILVEPYFGQRPFQPAVF